MSGIVVSRRSGIVRGPDGAQHRVARGQTLADARHPIVLAYPGDWQPVEIALSVDGAEPDEPGQGDELEQLRNDLAESEDLAERGVAELERLAAGLAERGVPIPDEEAREEGWLVDLALATMDTATAEEAPPRPARRKPAAVPR